MGLWLKSSWWLRKRPDAVAFQQGKTQLLAGAIFSDRAVRFSSSL